MAVLPLGQVEIGADKLRKVSPAFYKFFESTSAASRKIIRQARIASSGALVHAEGRSRLSRHARMLIFLHILTSLARAGVGAILIVAAFSKFGRGQEHFRSAILGYDLLPDVIASLAARLFPVIELIAGVLLICGYFYSSGLIISFALIYIFTAAVTISLLRGHKNHCGCNGFTVAQVKIVQWKLAYRNLALLVILILDNMWPAAYGITYAIGMTSSNHSIGTPLLTELFASIVTAVVIIHLRVAHRA